MYDLYAEEILDHYKFPRNKGPMDNPDRVYHDRNPFCGDEVTFMLKVRDGVVEDVKWEGRGCTISMASASMLSEEVKGQPLEALRNWGKEKVLELLGIPLSPTRLKCALLPLKVLQVAAWGTREEGEVTSND
ncbi:MAG: iron-sulfur cluster assembly scaffold protein [Chloroflexi bacterium]|nr:iron-sulfur cluster assembly scaffold protein [Chloroflexota bacterium]